MTESKQLGLFAGDSLVNRSALPGSDAARTITATYGQGSRQGITADIDGDGRIEAREGIAATGRHGVVGNRGRETVGGMGGKIHGIPGRVDRLKQLGNAVVPEIPEIFGRAIIAAETQNQNGEYQQ